MNITIDELKGLSSLIVAQQHIEVDNAGGSVTIRVKTNADDKLLKKLVLKVGHQSADIDKLGIYVVGGIKFWIVKE